MSRLSRPWTEVLARRRRTAVVLVSLVLVGCLVAVVAVLLRDRLGVPGAGDPSESPASSGSSVSAESARLMLAQVAVRGRAPTTGYRRAAFGSGWASVAGCDMRNRILARDLTAVLFRPGTRDCVVTSGVLLDPYTGRRQDFVRGNTTSTLVQIDHRVPLLLAWQQGAQSWDAARREQFANDPDNLVAVNGSVNQAKGASGPGSWLPPNRAYRCAYVISFVVVVARYQLSVNPGDRDGADRVLRRC